MTIQTEIKEKNKYGVKPYSLPRKVRKAKNVTKRKGYLKEFLNSQIEKLISHIDCELLFASTTKKTRLQKKKERLQKQLNYG